MYNSRDGISLGGWINLIMMMALQCNYRQFCSYSFQCDLFIYLLKYVVIFTNIEFSTLNLKFIKSSNYYDRFDNNLIFERNYFMNFSHHIIHSSLWYFNDISVIFSLTRNFGIFCYPKPQTRNLESRTPSSNPKF